MPISREEIRAVVERYPRSLVVATVGSHAALDVADGAVTEGFPSLVLAQEGRESTYSRYFRTLRSPGGHRLRGCVDDVWTYPRFDALAAPDAQERLRHHGALLVPNRALSSYVPLDVIENSLLVPIVGSRHLLRIEERTERENYYTLLESAGIPIPRALPGPDAIDGLAIVKLPHASRRLERGFFTAATSPSTGRRPSA